VRYRRQTAGVELPVTWNRLSIARIEELRQIFETKYEELYGVGAGYTKAGIEISAIRVDAIGRVAKPRLEAQRKKAQVASAKKGKRKIFFTRPERKLIDTQVYDYSLWEPARGSRGLRSWSFPSPLRSCRRDSG
jgi:N-methylhydantoinase A/oxoprolinase/acetone carboxylase beta subunit